MEKMSSHSSRTILANFPCDIHESGGEDFFIWACSSKSI